MNPTAVLSVGAFEIEFAYDWPIQIPLSANVEYLPFPGDVLTTAGQAYPTQAGISYQPGAN